VGMRFAACNWHVQKGDMYDADGLRAMVAAAKAESGKPSLIMLKSIIGKGAPTLQGSAKTHGAPLGAEEIAKARAAMGVPEGADFYVDPAALAFFAARRQELAQERAAWLARFAAWEQANPGKAGELKAALSGRPIHAPEWPAFKPGETLATRAASGKALTAAAGAWPQLVGGSADLTGPNSTQLPGQPYSKANRAGAMLHFGIREHAMAAACNGMALHGGIRPFCATFLVFADYLRPSLRLSALMKLPVVYVLTHDSVFVGEDGPTHQPIEHLASLRAIPGLLVLRPADAEETAHAWAWAMDRTEGPTAIVLSRQNLPVFAKADPDWTDTFRTGAYVVKNTVGDPDIVIAASGSEVELALKASELLTGPAIRVLSVPSLETFLAQPKPIRSALVPDNARLVSCEAGRAMGWEGIAHASLSIERFGESAPGATVAKHLGLSVERLAELVNAQWLAGKA